MSKRGALVLAAMLILTSGLLAPGAAEASDGGMGGGGVPSARGPTYDPRQEFHIGMASLSDGKYRDAKRAFEHVLVVIPDQPLALSMLGQAEAALGDLKGAARDYAASLRVDPNQIIPARELAITDAKLGRRDQAAAQLQKLKQRADACAEACAEAGDLSAAVRDVEAAVSPASGAAMTPAKSPAG